MGKKGNGAPKEAPRFRIALLGPFSHAVLDTREVDEHERYVVQGVYRSAATARRVAREEEEAAADRGEP